MQRFIGDPCSGAASSSDSSEFSGELTPARSARAASFKFAARLSVWSSVAVLLGIVATELRGAVVSNALEIYDQTTGIVTAKFYDRTFRGLPWEKMVAAARGKLAGEVDEKKLQATINDLLQTLHSSHTEFLSARDQEYWALKSIFSREVDGAPFPQVGAWFAFNDGRWFVQNTFANSPAEKAGLLSGDEIVSADGRFFEPIKTFADSVGQPVRLLYRRTPDELERTALVTPETQSTQRALLNATLASHRVFPAGEKRVGYFHLWTGTHPQFQAALTRAVREFADGTDGMILDLRDGFGGAGPSWLNPFFDHDEEGRTIPQLYSKPLVVLINGGTRSGKEWLAFILQQTKRAILVGTRSAGYFVAGQPFEVGAGRFLLFLAVNGDGPSGVDIEGKGVTPEIEVNSPLPYSAGKDPQLEAAMKEMTARISRG